MDDPSQVDESLRADHRAYVIGAVFMAVAFLEAIINERFDTKPPRIQTLEKYRTVLQSAQKPPFNKGVAPHQAADALIFLRVGLVHFEPSQHWETGETGPKAKRPDLLKRLSGKFTVMNPLYLPRSHFLHRYLGHGCAEWAVQSALAFTDDFFQRLGETPPYEYARPRLNTRPPADVG